MRYSSPDDTRIYNLHIELDTKHCSLTGPEIEKMERGLDPLAAIVADFPVSDLYITVAYYDQTRHYEVKTALVLTGTTLFSADHDDAVHPAYERCVRKLIQRVEAYKDRLSSKPEQSKQEKGTHQTVLPTALPPEQQALDRAVGEGDYRAFRESLLVYEEPLRKRVGRWVQRYPELDAQIDRLITLNDIVEEVFLTAFERYEHRPKNLLLNDWLESLIDPALRDLVRHFDEEIENINFARSSAGTPPATAG